MSNCQHCGAENLCDTCASEVGWIECFGVSIDFCADHGCIGHGDSVAMCTGYETREIKVATK